MLSAWTGTVITADTRVWTRPLTERTVCVSAELTGVCFCEPCPFALPLLPTPHAHPRPQLWGHGKEQSGSDRPSGMRMLEEDFNSLHVVQIIPSGRSKSQALARVAQQPRAWQRVTKAEEIVAFSPGSSQPPHPALCLRLALI